MLRKSWIILLVTVSAVGCGGRFDRSAASKIVGDLAKGELQDESGVLSLDGNNSTLSQTGKAYVTSLPSNGQAVLFVTWRGKGKNMKGQLYCPTPLGVPSEVEIVSPGFGGTVRAERLHKIFADVEKTTGKNWYAVSYRLD
ncbi:hypothetical protein ACFL2H_02955 [Planctomycetota bacterium]